MKEDLKMEDSVQMENVLTKMLRQEVAGVQLAIGAVATTIATGNICDVVLPGLDMF
ncbi:hypothetical protein ABE545_16700 [Sphingobacterium faecium]|jgi:hypothetical protein|uniref:hypothetical protein n=1 Tax=Sphingobacterium faecium TaxID=34087 RepID=UPI00320A8FB5